MRAPSLRGQVLGGLLIGALVTLSSRPALAWDPATTHSGLTERAISASKFHATLAGQLGRPLGAFEPLRLDADALGPDLARSFKSRLARFDPAGGYRPNADGVASASAWVRAGSVIEMTPPERGRHHFLEPRKRTGLDDGPGLSGMLHATRLTLDSGATVRESMTGVAFDIEGMPALDWVWSPRNELGLSAFFQSLQRAVSAPQATERETALVRALLALGATLAVLEDMGQPAFVRNDFRAEFLSDDAGSVFERFVADTYGAVALPSPTPKITRPDIDSFFMAADGKGLAQRTQQRFFSPGTLPPDTVYEAGEDIADLVRRLNQALSFPSPEVTTLDVRQPGRTGYMEHDGDRVLAYQRNGNKIHFFLDRTVYADCARHWLPQVEAYAAGLVDHLFRVRLAFSMEEKNVSIKAAGFAGQPEPGTTLHILAEDASGARKEIAQAPLQHGNAVTVALPAGMRKIAAYARGRDGGGAYVAVGEVTVP